MAHVTTERAPEGSLCHRHQDRDAYLICPRCRKYCCAFCYHSRFAVCESCLQADPASVVPRVPFENAERSWAYRIGMTLLRALQPSLTAPAFAQPERTQALRFFLLSAVPLSLLAGVIPHTRELLFANMAITVLGTPDTATLILDVVRAMAVQLALDAVHLAALWLPFISLLRAYAGPDKAQYGRRALLYRAWLLPISTLLTGLFLWPQTAPAAGQDPAEGVLMLLALPQLLPVFLLLAMGYTARLACGLSTLWSIVITAVAATVAAFATDAALTMVKVLLPPLAG